MREMEEARERNEGLAYEDYHDRFSENAEQEDDGYELDDPKSPGYHDTFSDISDNAEQVG